MVVYKAISELPTEYGRFEIATPNLEWDHRGEVNILITKKRVPQLLESETNKMIRCDASDNTTGFFVALIRRMKETKKTNQINVLKRNRENDVKKPSKKRNFGKNSKKIAL